MVTVSQLMTKQLVTVPVGTSAADAARVMNEHHVGSDGSCDIALSNPLDAFVGKLVHQIGLPLGSVPNRLDGRGLERLPSFGGVLPQ